MHPTFLVQTSPLVYVVFLQGVSHFPYRFTTLPEVQVQLSPLAGFSQLGIAEHIEESFLCGVLGHESLQVPSDIV